MKTLLIGILFLPVVMCAQMNESDPLSFKADLSITGFWQGGNVETLILRTKSGISFKPLKKWIFKTQNSYVFQEFGKKKADADFLSLNFLYVNPERILYPLILGFVSTNFRREIELRSLFGVGITYQLINQAKDQHKNWLKLSLSGEYEQTRFKRPDFNLIEYNNNRNMNTFRSTLWVNGNYHLFKKKLIFKHEMYFQPSLEDRNNYRWWVDVAIEFPLWKYLNFKVNYLRSYENIVISNQRQKDEFLTFGLKLKSY